MNFQVIYRSIFDLVRDFMKDEAFNQRDKTLRRYLNPELLIIDDFGLKQLPRNSGEHLFEVIMRRYENRSTIMTSNRPLEEWGKLWAMCPRRVRSWIVFCITLRPLLLLGGVIGLKTTPPSRGKEDKNNKP
jgi:DNA replication protein DnaC